MTTVKGIEIVPEHTHGTFTGYSTGSPPGDWIAVVKQTPLSPNATITGGTFTLATSQHHKTRTVTGRSAAARSPTPTGRQLHEPDLQRRHRRQLKVAPPTGWDAHSDPGSRRGKSPQAAAVDRGAEPHRASGYTTLHARSSGAGRLRRAYWTSCTPWPPGR